MDYLILTAIFVIAFVLFLYQKNKRRENKGLEAIRAGWGKPKPGPFYFGRIAQYADQVKGNGFHRLTSQTIDDIDLEGLFTFLDRTTSRVGQQFLFKKLMEPSSHLKDPSADLVERFSRDQKIREQIQTELLNLSNRDAYNIASLLRPKLIERPRWLGLLGINIALMLVLIGLSFISPVFLVMLIFPCTLNMLIHYWNKTNALLFISSFPQLNLLINVSKGFSTRFDFLHDKEVEKNIAQLRYFQFNTRLINFDIRGGVQGELNMLATYVLELIKAFFLIEVYTFFRVIKDLEGRRDAIISLFDYVGNIDTCISVASLRAGKSKTCQPVLVPATKKIVAKNIYHPLIEDCERNSLTILGKGILITGSNMSGKSTFLRTFILNSICAQTIYTCFGDEFVSPVLKQFSSIKIEDNLLDGSSYYFQEVKTMGALVAEVDTPHQHLFVLDEVFKGTNTMERVAAAKAVLSYLNRNDNIVMVSTHDIELAGMLADEYNLYHFTDTIDNNELHFDYLIKPGQLTTRNAIRILEFSRYPTDIVNEANRISKRMLTSKDYS